MHDFIGVRMFAVGVDELAAYTGLSEEELREQYGLPGNGAIVSEVARGGPAAKAGVGGEKEEVESVSVPIGDVITEVEGNPVSSPDDVIEVVTSSEPGDELTLTVTTPGEEARQVGVRVDVRTEGA